MIAISSLVILACLIAVLFYSRSTNLVLQAPENVQSAVREVYITHPNSSGGITMVKRELAASGYAEAMSLLEQTPVSRKIIDWNASLSHAAQYELRVMAYDASASDHAYLDSMHLYERHNGKFAGYLVVERNGRLQSYSLRDKTAIKQLIEVLERTSTPVQ